MGGVTQDNYIIQKINLNKNAFVKSLEIQFATYATEKHNLNEITLYKNDELVFKRDVESEKLKDNEFYKLKNINLNVNKNDKLELIIMSYGTKEEAVTVWIKDFTDLNIDTESKLFKGIIGGESEEVNGQISIRVNIFEHFDIINCVIAMFIVLIYIAIFIYVFAKGGSLIITDKKDLYTKPGKFNTDIFFICSNILTCVLAFFLMFTTVISFIIKSMYNFHDYPYFSIVKLQDNIFYILIFLALMIILCYPNTFERVLKKRIIAVAYFVMGIIFILYVPLKPFSDMNEVFKISEQLAYNNWEALKISSYMDTNPNNCFIAILFGIILKICPSIVSIKIFNLLCTIGVAYFIFKIGKLFEFKYLNLLFFISITIIPNFLYINHIYGDTFFTFVIIGVSYFYLLKKTRFPICFLIFFAMCFIRPTGVIFAIAMAIDYFFNSSEVIKAKVLKICYSFVISVLILLIMSNIMSALTNDKSKTMPMASFIYIGLNEERFGFMDGTHSTDRTMEDVRKRISDYSFLQMSKILTKKVFWTWQQGTFQSERYAFGNDRPAQEKFSYDTFATKYVTDSSQRGRSMFSSFMRVQYMVTLLMTSFALLVKRNDSKYIYFVYSIIGFLLFYIVWETKSRYIFSIYPFMIIIGFSFFEECVDKLNTYKKNNN